MPPIPSEAINAPSRWLPGISMPHSNPAREVTGLITVTHGL
jgi:hypothetical protein